MSERPSYVCRECETPVSSGSYRAACPECGGTLRPRAYGASHGQQSVVQGDGT
jgi:Zn finger protein HypA/HybF involved in hydrogenase expression